jgi:flagellar biosynthetic protein FlhB
MAESDGAERSEEPSDKRLREAREKGQVARSRELTTTVMLLGSAVGLLLFGTMIVEAMMTVMRTSFTTSREKLFDTAHMASAFQDAVSYSLMMLSPFLVLMVIAAVVGSIAISGWNFTLQAIAPKFSKLNPLSGMKRIIGPQGLMELAKALAKFVVISGAGLFVLYSMTDRVLHLGLEPVGEAIANAGSLLTWTFLAVSLSTILIAVVDVPFQLWNHKRQLKMTKQEVKQENKETQGSPEVKGRIRRMQMDISMKRMMAAVPEADVIITNPTHFAVAVKYDQANMRAPVVVAKGADYVAFEIRRIAQENNVPILSAPPLARAIYHTTEIDSEIPEGLYLAVARVLAYIFHLRRTAASVNPDDLEMSDLPIPDDLKH